EFLRNISDRGVFLSRKLNEFALQSLSNRIVSYLKYNGKISNIQELAFIMGVARPSVSRTLSSMVEQGILKKTDSGYVMIV
ncbi:MAG: helix-turn-helix domain-containing protein, partial [Butyricimonas virosa]|uniref:helix-turn-helix domain-containing protein n=1 Tax=Butyricimonas virosa TaxID=544645 RepID=UPI002A91EF0E